MAAKSGLAAFSWLTRKHIYCRAVKSVGPGDAFCNLPKEFGDRDFWRFLEEWKEAAPVAPSNSATIKLGKENSKAERKLYGQFKNLQAALEDIFGEKR
eukprot:3213829-Karenia_brevis.AAC.1